MKRRCQYLVFVLGLALALGPGLAGRARAAAGAAGSPMVTISGTVLDPAGAPAAKDRRSQPTQ